MIALFFVRDSLLSEILKAENFLVTKNPRTWQSYLKFVGIIFSHLNAFTFKTINFRYFARHICENIQKLITPKFKVPKSLSWNG